MPGPRFYVWTDEGDLCPWDLTGDAPVAWHDCAYWGQVFTVLGHLLADTDVDVTLTRRLAGDPPLTGSQTIAVVIRDGLGLEPSWAGEVGLVAKTNGGSSRRISIRLRSGPDFVHAPLTLAQELTVQLKRLRHKAQLLRQRGLHKPELLDVPLGTYLWRPAPTIPFDDRPVDVSFAGSMGNSEEEARRRIPSQKLRARRELFGALSVVEHEMPHLVVQTNQLVSFHWAQDHADGYSTLMASTKVALCPRGSGWDTYRWWEAMASGCVVVAEKQRSADYYRDSPAVVVDGWTRLSGVLRSLFSDPAGLRERAEASLRFWHAQGAPPAVARRICQAYAREARSPAPVV
jgi:hypothetical protein